MVKKKEPQKPIIPQKGIDIAAWVLHGGKERFEEMQRRLPTQANIGEYAPMMETYRRQVEQLAQIVLDMRGE